MARPSEVEPASPARARAAHAHPRADEPPTPLQRARVAYHASAGMPRCDTRRTKTRGRRACACCAETPRPPSCLRSVGRSFSLRAVLPCFLRLTRGNLQRGQAARYSKNQSVRAEHLPREPRPWLRDRLRRVPVCLAPIAPTTEDLHVGESEARLPAGGGVDVVGDEVGGAAAARAPRLSTDREPGKLLPAPAVPSLAGSEPPHHEAPLPPGRENLTAWESAAALSKNARKAARASG
jgi:hypothetical protein